MLVSTGSDFFSSITQFTDNHRPIVITDYKEEGVVRQLGDFYPCKVVPDDKKSD